jgi:hypothetical protein
MGWDGMESGLLIVLEAGRRRVEAQAILVEISLETWSQRARLHSLSSCLM